MRINEIHNVDPVSESFDALKNTSSKYMYDLFRYIKDYSNDFHRSASESFASDEISDFLFELEQFTKTSPFSSTDQVTEIVEKVQIYLKE